MKTQGLTVLTLAAWTPLLGCFAPMDVTPGMDDIWCDGILRDETPEYIDLDTMTSRGETPRDIYGRVVGSYSVTENLDLVESTLQGALDDTRSYESTLTLSMPDDPSAGVQMLRWVNVDCQDDVLLPIRATWHSEELGVRFDVMGELRLPAHDATHGSSSNWMEGRGGTTWDGLAFDAESALEATFTEHGHDPAQARFNFVAHLDESVTLPDDSEGGKHSWRMTVQDHGVPPGYNGQPQLLMMQGDIAPAEQ